ncbi:MAG TPA: hypothetical protein GXZ90_00770 [Clostridiales bacterium]|nr:hypothetical protein [Clostridiales bacterium]
MRNESGVLNSYNLKLIAIITMFIDHFTAVLIPSNTSIYMVLRGVGRLSFPIFAFLIVEGFYHTSNIKKYLIRLGLFALISEIPFDLAFYKKTYYMGHQNIFFTLLLGLILIALLEKIDEKYSNNLWLRNSFSSLLILFISTISIVMKTDYEFAGIFMILAFYYFRGYIVKLGIFIFFLQFILFGLFQTIGTLSIFIINKYNGKKGKSLKYFFYFFYPAHLMVLYIVYKYYGQIK